MQNPQDVQLAHETMKSRLPEDFLNLQKGPVAIVLGTGLSGIADRLSLNSIPFSELPNFPIPSVESHAGAFLYGFLGQVPVLIQQGRCHLYEGKTPAQVCMGVRLMASLGAKTLLVTNSAGALNPLFNTGELMLVSDMINHAGQSPLTGENCSEWGERFPDMSAPFDAILQDTAMRCALKLGIRLERGVYIGVHGPEMETPAETRMYRHWGADAIGMSSVLEVIAARHLGMRVMGISCLTNKNLPDCMESAPLSAVVAVAEKAGRNLEKLILAIVEEIGKMDYS